MSKNSNFTKKRMFNDKYVTSKKWILPDEKDYKYNINWIMAIIVGGFFLYALFFSGMMLARRQIEFLFLFLKSYVALNIDSEYFKELKSQFKIPLSSFKFLH